MTTHLSRRSTLRGVGGLLALGLAIPCTTAVGTARPDAPPDETTVLSTISETMNDGWNRLYQGTAAVTVTYHTGIDRVASGAFAVDVRFGDTRVLDSPGAPFQFDVQTTEMLHGNFVVQENSNPYLPAEPMIEGSVHVATEVDSVFRGPERLWSVVYDPATEGVQGALTNGSNETVNTLLTVSPFLGRLSVGPVSMGSHTTVEGTVGHEGVSLAFEITDTALTVSASVLVTADRVL